jgi:hypothetical protein
MRRGQLSHRTIPRIRESSPELFVIYGRMASTGIPETFRIDFTLLNLWLIVPVFSPNKGYFVAVFENLSGNGKPGRGARFGLTVPKGGNRSGGVIDHRQGYAGFHY